MRVTIPQRSSPLKPTTARPSPWPRRSVCAHSNPLDVAQAEAHYQQALTLAEALGMRPLQAHCHLGLGTLYTRAGQQEQARAALSMAIGLYRAMDMHFWLPQAEAALAQTGGAGSVQRGAD